jgi:hypothetical protein
LWKKSRTPDETMQQLLFRWVRDPREKLKVPDTGMPRGELNTIAIIATFEAGKEALIKFMRDSEIDVCAAELVERPEEKDREKEQ